MIFLWRLFDGKLVPPDFAISLIYVSFVSCVQLNPTVSWPLIGRAVSTYFQTHCWPDWAQIWTANSPAWLTIVHAPLNSCNFLAFVWWSRYTVARIELKFGGPPQASSTFSHAPGNSLNFLASDWPSNLRAFAVRPLIGLSSKSVYQLISDFPGLTADCNGHNKTGQLAHNAHAEYVHFTANTRKRLCPHILTFSPRWCIRHIRYVMTPQYSLV